ncbi:long-chain-fatty-acid--CoA ligase FadD15 [Bacteroidaceae bacterium]|uniref:AMP-dependent synthetase/ligase n=1 Tax=Prevotella sp. MGM2 TaxID=2033406 RepID=UPI000CE9E843|nr:long-chain fatty acid--CoA ligase [Prevotella sp. MGM2]GAY29607.1 long-chain-fatty-acid-CoA ligase [Prevotella sp. MGM2]GFI35305.1 long-chain-fatty-acid--CoA ligase FadD15 [Bacteroidaceae bacterium]
MLNNCHLSKLIHEQADKYESRTALSWRDYDRNQWTPVSWREVSDTVHKVSRALLELGVGVQENLAVFSQNKPECLYVDFGAYGIRAVTIPFYATSSGAQVAYMINDAGVRFIFVGEQFQYDVAFGVISVCPTLEKIIIFDRSVKRKPNDNVSVFFDDFLNCGCSESHEATLAQRMSEASFSDCANILYTSGTTGASKGVILTYSMYHEGLRVNDAVLSLGERDVILNFLPFTHIFERAWSYLCLAEGARLAINLRPNDVLRSLQEVHPTCMSSVPRFWEKVYQGVQEKMEQSSFLERKLIEDAIAVGARCWTEYLSQGKSLPLSLSLKYSFYNKTIIRLLRKTLGLENANFFPTAGAAVSPQVEKFVHAAGINIIVGYGLTESTATVSCDISGLPITLGSVGRLIDGIEIKFGENDEILLRGKTITPGYYKKDSATKAAIDEEGWFHTGDAGYMKDGELFLKERIKDLFKTSNGKYIAPQMIESKLVIDKYLEQAVIVADQHKFVSALIVPDFHLLRKYAEEKGISAESNEALCENADIRRMIEERIETLQQDLAHYEKVKRFVLLPAPFTIETGELTNTLKVKRRVVYERYAEIIENIYKEAEKEASQSS